MKKIQKFVHPAAPARNFQGLFTFLADNKKDEWIAECQAGVGEEFMCRAIGNGTIMVPNQGVLEVMDASCSGGYPANLIVVSSKEEITLKKFGKVFFSLITEKLYDSAEEALFQGEREFLRSQLHDHGIHGSWEWLFLPFLENSETWIFDKKEELFAVLQKINVPLKSEGMRIIPHDSYGVYGPSQIPVIASLLNWSNTGRGVVRRGGRDIHELNNLGKNTKYIKLEGEAPEKLRSDLMWIELAITKAVAEGKKFLTNITYDTQKLEAAKKFFAEATVSDSRISQFGNTGEPSLSLKHPNFESQTSVNGTISRTFLKKFCKSYESVGVNEYVNFTNNYSSDSLPDFHLISKK